MRDRNKMIIIDDEEFEYSIMHSGHYHLGTYSRSHTWYETESPSTHLDIC